MSMIIATFENGELMPSRADAFFRYHDGEATQVEEDGNVEGPVGHFTLRRVTRDDIAKYVSEHGDPWASMTRNIAPGWYVDARGEDGAVWAFYYGEDATLNEETARREFAEAQRLNSDWYAEADIEDARPNVTDATPYLIEITTEREGQPVEPVTSLSDAEEAATFLSPHPELTEVVDPEHGMWNVWLPNYMTNLAWSDGLYIDLRVGGYRLHCDLDPA